MNTLKAELHSLVDMLPEHSAAVVKKCMEFMLKEQDDVVIRAFINAPEDDEPTTTEDLAAIAEAREDIKAGRVFSLDEVKRDLGI